MSASEVSPLASAVFLVAAFTAAGFCHTVWLASPVSQRFATPIDGRRTIFGQRLFGANKTVRGFVMMVPATGVSFAALATLLTVGPGLPAVGLWPLSPVAYGLIGLWAGLGFMVGELPNSFVKRQLGVPPGAVASGRFLLPFFVVVDRLDSIVGMLLALSFVVPVPWRVWMYLALIGPLIHWGFSLILFQLGVKTRAA